MAQTGDSFFKPAPPGHHRARTTNTWTSAHPLDGVVRPAFEGGLAVRVRTKSSGALEDWAGVHADLGAVIAYADQALAFMDAGGTIEIVERALTSAALIAYGRCFGSGIRHLAQLDLSGLTSEELKAHQHFRDLRDKYIAHSINSHEQNITHAVLAEPPADPELLQVNHLHVSSDPLNHLGFTHLRALATKLEAQLGLQFDQALANVRAEVLAISLDHLYSIDPLEIHLPGVEESGLSRRQRPRKKRSRAPDA